MRAATDAELELDTIKAVDESDWPGGVEQKFRALKPSVDALLEGYGARFVGALEVPADGVGKLLT